MPLRHQVGDCRGNRVKASALLSFPSRNSAGTSPFVNRLRYIFHMLTERHAAVASFVLVQLRGGLRDVGDLILMSGGRRVYKPATSAG